VFTGSSNIRPLKRPGRQSPIGAINCFLTTSQNASAPEGRPSQIGGVVQSSHERIVAKTLNGIITDLEPER